MATCANCGENNPDRARFCLACGAALAVAEAAHDVRKTVSVLFCDVTGSTAMGERLDPESLRTIMARYFDEMRVVIEAHGGKVEKFIGDAVMAVFGVPVLHEDDALRAVRSAADMRSALARLNEELDRGWGTRIQTRIGVNTGEVVAGSGEQTIATGDAVNTAARLEQHAQPGEILLGEPTYALVRHAVRVEAVPPIDAKGKGQPLDAYRLLAVFDVARDVGRRLDSPLVGRAHELQLAEEAFGRAARERSCHLFTVFGSAGVGKSRLTQEVLERVESRATVVRGRCLPYGRGITFWPLAEIVHDVAGLSGDETPTEAQAKIEKVVEGDPSEHLVAERVAGLIGLGDATGSTEESFWAVRKLFESLGRRRPVVVLFDDIHWAEPTLLDLIESIADWTNDAAIMLMCLARPELLDGRPGWAGGKVNATSIRLEPLRDDESEALIANLLGGLDLPPAVLGRITDASGGTPLFVEEMIGMLVDDGMLALEDGAWKVMAPIDDVPVPPTISALLAARLDRLSAQERTTIEAASVVGKEFWKDAVGALLPGDGDGVPSDAIMSLVRKDILRPDRSRTSGDESYRFRHILIRNAAYGGISKNDRARLHEAFATWLEQRFHDRMAEYEEIVGYHLEQAFETRASLGPADEKTRELAVRAAGALASSGRRALARGDDTAARVLLGRASALAGNSATPDLLFDFARSMRFEDATRAMELFDEAAESARRAGDHGLEWRARVQRTYAYVQTVSGVRAVPEAKRVAVEAIRVLEELGDHAGSADAWAFLAECHNSVGEQSEMLRAADRAVEHARLAGDAVAEFSARRVITSAFTWGPAPVSEFVARARLMMEESRGSPLLEASAMGAMGGALALGGEFEESRTFRRRSSALYRELGQSLALSNRGFTEGQDEMLAGEFAAAEGILRESCDALERIGEVGLLSTLVCVHGESLYQLGRFAEAEACSVRGEELGALDDLATQIYWRGLRAKCWARRGRAEEALAFAHEAVVIARTTQGLHWQAQSLVDHAEALEVVGRPREALDVAREALELFERKGIVPLIDRTKKRIARLEASGSV
jgi:predicted ATPase/class 3 adenylate cyclase